MRRSPWPIFMMHRGKKCGSIYIPSTISYLFSARKQLKSGRAIQISMAWMMFFWLPYILLYSKRGQRGLGISEKKEWWKWAEEYVKRFPPTILLYYYDPLSIPQIRFFRLSFMYQNCIYNSLIAVLSIVQETMGFFTCSFVFIYHDLPSNQNRKISVWSFRSGSLHLFFIIPLAT